MVEADRPRGILSRSNREYLVGESDVETKSQQERNIRSDIRERVREGILDFRYLANPEYLQNRDFYQLLAATDDKGGDPTRLVSRFEDEEVDRDEILDKEVESGLIELVAFLFRVYPSQESFERLISKGVERGLSRIREDAAIVDPVRVPIEDRDNIADRVEELIDEGVRLSDTEVRVALEQGIRPPNEIAEHVQEHGTSNLSSNARKHQRNIQNLLFPDDSTPEERMQIMEKLDEVDIGELETDDIS